MAIDSSIYSMVAPQQPLTDPLAAYGKVATVQNLIGQNQLQGMQTQQLQKKMDTENAVGSAFKASGGDPAKIRQAYIDAGDHAGLQAWDKAQLEAKVHEATIEKSKVDALKEKIGITRDILTGVKDDAGLIAAKESLANLFSPDFVAKMGLPEAYSPEAIAAATNTVTTFHAALQGDKTRKTTERGQDMTAATAKTGQQITIRGQNMADSRARDANAISSGNQNVNTEGKLRDDYNKLSQDFVKVRDAHQRVLASAKDPSAAGDLALIFNYMKVLDPGSTVREGEFATAQNSGSIPDLIRSHYNKAIAGERLSDPIRNDFVDRSGRLYKAAENNQKAIEKQYTDIATRSSANPENVVAPQRVVESAAPVALETKVINGRTFVKKNGQWFESN